MFINTESDTQLDRETGTRHPVQLVCLFILYKNSDTPSVIIIYIPFVRELVITAIGILTPLLQF